jgi:hypothetical protein
VSIGNFRVKCLFSESDWETGWLGERCSCPLAVVFTSVVHAGACSEDGHFSPAEGERGRGLFQLGADEEPLSLGIPGDVQEVGLAADLAVFDIILADAGRLVHRGGVPFSATGALKPGFHIQL